MTDVEPFRRRVTLRRVDATTVAGDLEDHIHHFAVTVVHDDRRVVGVDGAAVRAPWSQCPGAIDVLGELVGVPIGAVPRPADVTEHCTHLLDLAQLAVRFAGSGLDRREYRATVTGWDGPRSTATLERDGSTMLGWSVEKRRIVDPPPYAGRDIGAGFTAWTTSSLDPDESEAALILRRATWMSASRGIDLDAFVSLGATGVPPGTCFASRPDRIDRALRVRSAGRS